MCLNCGFYKGRQVIDLVAAKEARQARIKAKEERIRLQREQIDETEANTVAEQAPEIAPDEQKK
jgi:hypothetical protein